MTSDAQIEAAVRRVLAGIMSAGAPYVTFPLVDPTTGRFPEPTMLALAESPEVTGIITGAVGDIAGGLADSAEASAQAAEDAKTAAGTAAFNAGASAAAAQSSEDDARDARTAAETARGDAQTARDAAQSARTGAEAARDLALAGQFAGSSIPASGIDVNSLTTPGVYRFTTATATASQNLPRPQAGIMEVFAITGTVVYHRFTPTGAAFFFERVSNVAPSSWGPWRTYASQRINSPADQPGLEVFTWDDVNNREQQLQTVNLDPSTTSLDLVTIPGRYRQLNSSAVTLANGYPVAGVIGTLDVQPLGSTYILQTFTPVTGSAITRGQYMRRAFVQNGVATWQPWRFMPTQRVDQTAGRAVYTWDDLNAREQLIYGDTGWRDVKPIMLTGWGVNVARIRRFGSTVTLILDNLLYTPEAASGEFLTVPTGFRVLGGAISRFLLHTTTTPTVAYRGTFNGGSLSMASPTLGMPALYGEFSWQTSDPWPTTLPGTAVGSIPV